MTRKEAPPRGRDTGAGAEDCQRNDKRHSPNLQEVLRYAERGWPVLPLFEPAGKGCSCRKKKACGHPCKHPRIKGGAGFSNASTDPDKIRHWWQDWPHANVGVQTGAASGLVVIDVDPENGGNKSLAELVKEHGELPPTVESLTGGNGRHFVFKHPGGTVRNRQDIRAGIDVRGDGGYFVAPPSCHVSGGEYKWREGHSPQNREPAALPDWLGDLAHKRDTDYRPRPPQKTPLPHTQPNPPIACESTRPSSPFSPSSLLPSEGKLEAMSEAGQAKIREAIKQTVPAQFGQRHDALFVLGRYFLDIPEVRKADDNLLVEIVTEWHREAYPNIKTKPLDDTLGEFFIAWERVRLGISTVLLEDIVARAKAMQPPGWALVFDEQTQQLILVCQELQRWHGSKPFYLAGAKAAEAVGLSSRESGRLRLKLLVRRGVLHVARRHTRKQATYYFFLPPLDGDNNGTKQSDE